MLKRKSVLPIAVSIFLLFQNLTAVTASAQTISSGPIASRLAGSDRYATSLAIVKNGWTHASNVIIATGSNFPDALSASALSKSKDAPIILTEKSALSTETLAELSRLGTTNAFIIGGTGVISSSVQNQLKDLNITFKRFAGTDRYDTSRQIAAYIGVNNGIAAATGSNFPDALSIASIASIKEMPILLSPKTGLDPNTAAFIKGKNIPVSYIVGGTGVLDGSLDKSLPNSIRLSGSDRYATNLAVNNEFASGLNFDTVYLATGNSFPDALSGSALAAKNNAPIILTDKNSISTDTLNFMKSKHVKHVVIIGGTGAVSQAVEDQINTELIVKGYVYNTDFQVDLNVRSAPSLSGSIIGHLYNYEKIEILNTVVDSSNKVWDEIIFGNSTAYVSNAYIQQYTSPPDSTVSIAVSITKQFEVGTSNQIAGNFDGEGLSLGYLQWCIGQGALQPLLNRMDRQFNSEMQTIFGTNYDAVHSMILDTQENQLIWAEGVNDHSNNIISPWYSQFVSLTNNQDYINIEKDAEVYTVKQAMIICDKYNLKTVRGFALAFDIVNQNGSISSAAAQIINTALQQNPGMTEKSLLSVIANAAASTSGGNSADVLSRKMAIVNGQGMVHGTMLNLDADYGLSDNRWR